jgi:PHP family Zn ribbon phosphoesterase
MPHCRVCAWSYKERDSGGGGTCDGCGDQVIKGHYIHERLLELSPPESPQENFNYSMNIAYYDYPLYI